ncbi:MAG: hypothetical protein KJ042_03835, partial [Deltaproteobacteria bacterium]|nr:hypothetical protein [Deltaproteobacteria bacterium]
MNRFPLLIALFAILLGMLPACGGSGFEEPAHAPVDSRDDAASHRQDFLDAPDVDVPFYLYSRRCSREDILDAVERIRSDGGYVRLIHGGVALSASGPAELVERLFHREEFAIVMEGENAPPIDAAQECVSAIRTTLLAWANEAETREKADLPPTAVGSPLVNDAFEAPHDASTIWTTGPMLGDVGVFLFTPESDGTIDANAENWSQGMWDQIYAEVSAGIGFWPTHAAGYGKTVTFELFALPLSDPALQTGYEPITRPRSDQCLWIQEVLGNLGYNDANCFRNVSRFNADQMLLHEKDAFV